MREKESGLAVLYYPASMTFDGCNEYSRDTNTNTVRILIFWQRQIRIANRANLRRILFVPIPNLRSLRGLWKYSRRPGVEVGLRRRGINPTLVWLSLADKATNNRMS